MYINITINITIINITLTGPRLQKSHDIDLTSPTQPSNHSWSPKGKKTALGVKAY